MRPAPAVPALLFLTGGLGIWAVRFLAGYGFTAVACAKGWRADAIAGIGVVQLGLVAMSVVALGGCGILLVRALGDRASARRSDPGGGFIGSIAALVAALAMLAIVWETLPVFLVPACRP